MAEIKSLELDNFMREYYTKGPNFGYIYSSNTTVLKDYEVRIFRILKILCDKKELKETHFFGNVNSYELSDFNQITHFPLSYVKYISSKIIDLISLR